MIFDLFIFLISEQMYKEQLQKIVKIKDTEKRKLTQNLENHQRELKHLEHEKSQLALQLSDHESSFGNLNVFFD